jgi:hypothetical protein
MTKMQPAGVGYGLKTALAHALFLLKKTYPKQSIGHVMAIVTAEYRPPEDTLA